MTAFIPYDCSRCHGYMQVKDNLLVSCNSRETCKRYLARKDIGERTPFILPECDNNEKCEHYWEHKNESHRRQDEAQLRAETQAPADQADAGDSSC